MSHSLFHGCLAAKIPGRHHYQPSRHTHTLPSPKMLYITSSAERGGGCCCCCWIDKPTHHPYSSHRKLVQHKSIWPNFGILYARTRRGESDGLQVILWQELLLLAKMMRNNNKHLDNNNAIRPQKVEQHWCSNIAIEPATYQLAAPDELPIKRSISLPGKRKYK